MIDGLFFRQPCINLDQEISGLQNLLLICEKKHLTVLGGRNERTQVRVVVIQNKEAIICNKAADNVHGDCI